MVLPFIEYYYFTFSLNICISFLCLLCFLAYLFLIFVDFHSCLFKVVIASSVEVFQNCDASDYFPVYYRSRTDLTICVTVWANQFRCVFFLSMVVLFYIYTGCCAPEYLLTFFHTISSTHFSLLMCSSVMMEMKFWIIITVEICFQIRYARSFV